MISNHLSRFNALLDSVDKPLASGAGVAAEELGVVALRKETGRASVYRRI